MKIEKVKLKKEDLNEEYITSHADRVSWRHVSLSMNLESFSDSFYERFHRELKWKWMMHNKSITTQTNESVHNPTILNNKSMCTCRFVPPLFCC